MQLDKLWVQQSMNACAQLARLHSLNAEDKAVVEFAVKWAPYPEAAPAELFWVTFGVHREAFDDLVRRALCPKPNDLEELRVMKGDLWRALTQAWRFPPQLQVMRPGSHGS